MRPSEGKFDIWPLAVIGFIVVLVVASINPVVRLNSEPPSNFVGLEVRSGKPDPVLAKQYWECSRKVLQWKYHRTDSLPLTPPSDFQPVTDEGTVRAQSGSVRRAYWKSLRAEWHKSENWHTHYTLDVSWTWRNLQSLWNGAEDFFRSRG
jgi:hypothetical protein